MPTRKVRKAPVKRDDAIDNVKRELAHLREQGAAFSIKELCDAADVSPSWFYRKGDAAVEALADEARSLLKKYGKSKRGTYLQAVPPEPENKSAIARDWIDEQIQYYSESIEALRQRQEQIRIELELSEKQVANLHDRLEHLHKVRGLTEKEID